MPSQPQPLVPPTYTINSLPLEILIVILSYVDSLTLQNLSLVCQKWHNILKSDAIWYEIFKLRFFKYPSTFPSLSRSTQFKNELIIRSNHLTSFSKGKLINQIYNNLIHFSNLSSIIKINWNSNKLFQIDFQKDIILLSNLANGKNRKFLSNFLPLNISTYDSNSSNLIIGKLDGSISHCNLNFKGLLFSNFKKLGNMHGDQITCTSLCNSLNPNLKTSDINLFTSDNLNNVNGWNLKSSKCLFSFNFNFNFNNHFNQSNSDLKIVKIKSNGKSHILVFLNNGDIFKINGLFDNSQYPNFNYNEINTEKIGVLYKDSNNHVLIENIIIDYGNNSILLWNETEVSCISIIDSNKIFYTPQNPNLKILNVSIENNDKFLINQNFKLVGNDPLIAAIVLNNNSIDLINIRENSINNFQILNVNNPIKPNFDNEFTNNNLLNNKISSICLTSTVIAICSSIGKVEIFDLITGKYIRTVIDRIGKKKIIESNLNLNLLNDSSINSSIVVQLDESNSRGLLFFGSYIQYFQCGELLFDNKNIKNKKYNNKKLIDKKGDVSDDIKFTLDNYEMEKLDRINQKKLLNKYNGSNDDNISRINNDDEMNLAIALNLSCNDIQNSNDYFSNGNSQTDLPLDQDLYQDEDENQLIQKALELSLHASNSIQEGNSKSTEFTHDEDLDHDLQLAIELSKQENYNQTWEQDNSQWEELV